MIRVLVAEDEPPILKSVCRNIERSSSLFTVVGRAFDGREAKAILEKEGVSIDVLVTDINMPVENGLELLEYVHEQYPDIITVVLSGFQEFEYAKQAFKFGVIDYLTKPIDRVQLHALLGRIAEIIEKSRSENLRQKLYNAVLAPPPANAGMTGRTLFSLALLCSGPFPISEYDYLLAGREFWDRHNLPKLTADHFGKQDFWVLPGKSSVEELLLVPALLEGKDRMVKSLYQTLSHREGPALTLYWSAGPYELHELAQAHHTARKRVHNGLVVGQSSFLRQNHETKKEMKGAAAEKLYERIRKDVTSLSNADLVPAVLEQISTMLSLVPRQADFEEFMSFVFNTVVNTAANTRNYRDIEASIKQLITSSSESESLIEGARELLDDILLPSGPRQLEKENKVREMAEYLALNYNKPVSNTTLSARFGLVPSYVSSIFKAHMGVTPSDYIRDIRMERAMELLGEDRGLLLKDIASMVGYSDPLYFSRVFKKHFGINPSQVKNKNQAER